jgi:hypothetical protein
MLGWIKNLKRPKYLKAIILLSLAENGKFVAHTGWYRIKASCDKIFGYKAKEIAREINFLRSIRGKRYRLKFKKTKYTLEF